MPETRYVVCLRNPLEVARSLQVRDGFSLAHGLRLWLTYTAAALEHSEEGPRLLVFYEDLLEGSTRTAAAIAEFIGRPPLSHDAATALVAPELRHHHASTGAMFSHRECPYPVSALYLILLSLASRANGGETHANTLVNACATSSVQTQVALDTAAGDTNWLVAPPSFPIAADVGSHAREYLAKHRPLVRALYRRLRRISRPWQGVGP